MRDPMECEAVIVRTRAQALKTGRCSMPYGFAFMLEITRVDGTRLAPMAVEDAAQVSQLIDDMMPERVAVEVGIHEDVDALRVALGIDDPGQRALH